MSSFTNPINQTLPTPGLTNKHTEEGVVRNFTMYWQNYLINFFSQSNKLTNGTGFDSDNIADKAITGIHRSANIVVAPQPLNEVSFGFTPKVIFGLTIFVPVAMADVTLNLSCGCEPTLLGNNLMEVNIQRVLNGNTTWTTVATAEESQYVDSTNLEFRWLRLNINSFKDIVPAVGTYSYRVMINHARVGQNTPPNNNTASTIKLTDRKTSYFTAEWQNARQ